MSLFPSPFPVVHIARIIDNNTIDPDTGNALIVDMDPVVRKVQSIGQTNSLTQEEQGDSVLRVVDDLTVAVSDPQTYAAGDQIIIDPMLDDDGNWIVGSGTAYRIEGTSNDSRQGPWPRLLKVFGGTISVRRVT